MTDFATAASYQIVTLVDRAMQGDVDIVHDGVRITFAKGQVEKAVPQFLAEWLLTVDQHKVHTADGQFCCRFAVKDAPDELVARCGPDAGNCDPIEIDTHRVEGWNTSVADRGPVRTIPLARHPEDFPRLASGATTFSGKER